MTSQRQSRRAFTALEVLLVTALWAAATAGWLGSTKAAPRHDTQAVSEASWLRKIAQRHYVATGQCPTMQALVAQHAVPFVQLDPWGKDYWFACLDGEVTVVSDGADRKPFTVDDVGDPALRAALPRRRGAS